MSAGSRACYLEIRGASDFVTIESPGGARLPLAVVSTFEKPRLGDVGVIGCGCLTVGGQTLVPARWWSARVPAVIPTRGALQNLKRLVPEPPSGPVASAVAVGGVEGLVGLGEGSTPAGDDWLAARLVTLAALGHEIEARREWERIVPYVRVTTPLSASLLRAASRGEAAGPVIDLLRALGGGRQLASAVRRVLALGASSGHWLALGVLAGTRSLDIHSQAPDG